MAILEKPILHNGFKIKEGLIVENRIERIFFTEVYKLSDDSYLYLFLDINPNDVINRKEKYNIIHIKNKDVTYLGVITDSYSKIQVSNIKEELIRTKGFECIAGMDSLKKLLVADVINPLRQTEKFKKFKVSIPNGIILYGPPGCGKTFIVRKLAEELDYNFFEIKHSDLATPYIHGAVSNIGKVFDIAKQNAPAVLFFDEISGLVSDRGNYYESSPHKEEELEEFLIQLNDAADNRILVVGTTNYIERIDPAILRPGRFDKKIYVPPPDFEARKALFKIGLENRPHDQNIDYDYLAKNTDGFTCADIIEDIIESAARAAANLNKSSISQKLIENEINSTKPKNKIKDTKTDYITHIPHFFKKNISFS
jgi:SpoVK/Ycf46/Vps4 family AAA+-type ATPase